MRIKPVMWNLASPGGKQCYKCKSTPFSARKRRSTGLRRRGGKYGNRDAGGECIIALSNEGNCRHFIKRRFWHVLFGVNGVINTGRH